MRLNMVGRFVYLAAVAAFFIVGFAPSAKAWHVQVHNPTDHIATVRLYVVVNIYGELKVVEEDIISRSSYTFKTGTKCPFALTGSIRGHVIKPTCLGPQKENVSSVHSCWPNCRNSEWAILEHYDETWHFGKGNYSDADTYDE